MKSLLHHHLWQRLPRSWRRELLFQATAAAAPRATRGARPVLPIIVAGTLRTASGLGESARLCHDALKASGLPIYGIDLTGGLMQPADKPDFAFTDGSMISGPGTLILHVNSPLVPLALGWLGRRTVREKYIIGYWAWELPKTPPDWRHGTPFLHEIWVPSQFTADAVRADCGELPVRVVPHPVALRGRPAPPYTLRNKRPFTALQIFNMASSFARKNPIATIAAFRKAFGDDPSTRLIVKVSNGRLFPSGIDAIRRALGSAQNVILVDAAMTTAGIEALYNDSDIVLSLHRSEGFGLTIAEAMLRGLPVVATNWSGNVDFFNCDYGFPVPYKLVPAEDPQATYNHPEMSWAEADVGTAAAALIELRAKPRLVRHLGDAGAAYALRAWSAQSYAERVRQLLGL